MFNIVIVVIKVPGAAYFCREFKVFYYGSPRPNFGCCARLLNAAENTEFLTVSQDKGKKLSRKSHKPAANRSYGMFQKFFLQLIFYSISSTA